MVGVSYYRGRNKPYVGRVMFNGKTYRKYFFTEHEAHEWYVNKNIELYGFNKIEPKLEEKEKEL